MATEKIPHIDKLIKDFGKQFKEEVRQANKAIEQAIKGINQLRESEGKTMKHNVTIIKEESRVIEEYWVMRAIKEEVIVKGTAKRVFKEQELDHNPSLQEIAQFLSETKADFVSVEHNYRFEPDLPFC